MNVNKKARELMTKYPNGITSGELIKELPDNFRMVVFGRMVFFAQEDDQKQQQETIEQVTTHTTTAPGNPVWGFLKGMNYVLCDDDR